LGACVRPIIIVLTVSIYDISGPDERQLVAAKELAEDLLTVVREEHAKAIASMTQNMGGYGGGYQQGGQQGYGQGGYGGYAGGYAVSIILSLYLIDMLISSRLDNSSSRDTMERILARHSNSLLCQVLKDKRRYPSWWTVYPTRLTQVEYTSSTRDIGVRLVTAYNDVLLGTLLTATGFFRLAQMGYDVEDAACELDCKPVLMNFPVELII
jgi:hypothetical protein